MRFSADLRQPYETPQAEKYAYVEEIIALLEMEDIADAIIGDPEAGLAVEQRKRVRLIRSNTSSLVLSLIPSDDQHELPYRICRADSLLGHDRCRARREATIITLPRRANFRVRRSNRKYSDMC